MSAQPAERHDPHDPECIRADLPGDERDFFWSQYLEHLDGARNPGGYAELKRLLRLWRFHADEAMKPDYAASVEAVMNGTGDSVPLEEVIREYRMAHGLAR